MSARVTPLTDVVVRCVPRQDDGFLIVTRNGSGSSPVAIPEGTRVVIEDGKARAA